MTETLKKDQWPYPLLKSTIKKNHIQEPEVKMQTGKVEKSEQIDKRKSFRRAEYHSEKSTQYDIPTETQENEIEDPIILHRTARDRNPKYRDARYAKENIDRIRQIRELGSKK